MLVTSQYSLFFISFLLFINGCNNNLKQEPAPNANVHFLPNHLLIKWEQESQPVEIEVRNENHQTLIRKKLDGLRRLSEKVIFAWEFGKQYEILTFYHDGRSSMLRLDAPQEIQKVRLSFQLPHGHEVGMDRLAPIEIPSGAEVQATVLLESLIDNATSFELSIEWSKGLVVSVPHLENSVSDDVQHSNKESQKKIRMKGDLRVALDHWYRQLSIRFLQGVEETQTIKIYVNFSPQGFESIFKQTICNLIPVSVATLQDHLEIIESVMPTDSLGKKDPRRRSDFIVLPSQTSQLFRKLFSLQRSIENSFSPITYQTLRIKNRSSNTLSAFVMSDIRALGGSAPIPELSPPEIYSGGTGRFMVVGLFPPNKVSTITLPIFVQQRKALSGKYIRHIEIRPLGIDKVILSKDFPLTLKRPNSYAFLFSLVATGLTTGVVLVLLIMHRKLFQQFTIRELVLISMISATMFTIVNIPGMFLYNVLYGFLGPFGFLITGLLDELIYYLLLVTLVILIPKPGTVSLAIVLKQLLSCVIFGSFTLPTLLFLGSSICFIESAFWFCGVTSRKKIINRYSTVPWWVIFFVASCLGVADAFVSMIHYHLQIVLYRFYLADWFILLAVVVNGFLYTFIGTVLGIRFGWQMRKISDV